MGDGDKTHLKLNFDPKVRLDFRDAAIAYNHRSLAYLDTRVRSRVNPKMLAVPPSSNLEKMKCD